jgi:hypothetical protein
MTSVSKHSINIAPHPEHTSLMSMRLSSRARALPPEVGTRNRILGPGQSAQQALDLRRVYEAPFSERAGRLHSSKLLSERRLGSA